MTYHMIKDNFLFGTGPVLFDTKIYPNLTVMLGSFEEQSIWWARSGTASASSSFSNLLKMEY